MRARRSRQPLLLVSLSLALVVLANFGLTVHTGDHPVGATLNRVSVQLLAGHSAPDSTLHLEGVSAVRTLTCPGCVLQHQIGGSHFPAFESIEEPTLAGTLAPVTRELPKPLDPSARSIRGPPAC